MSIEQAEIETTALIKSAIAEVVPKFDEIILVDFSYTPNGVWHRVEISWKDFLKLLQTGEFEERKLMAVSVVEEDITLIDGVHDKVRLVYDFMLLHTERNPWRLV